MNIYYVCKHLSDILAEWCRNFQLELVFAKKLNVRLITQTTELTVASSALELKRWQNPRKLLIFHFFHLLKWHQFWCFLNLQISFQIRHRYVTHAKYSDSDCYQHTFRVPQRTKEHEHELKPVPWANECVCCWIKHCIFLHIECRVFFLFCLFWSTSVYLFALMRLEVISQIGGKKTWGIHQNINLNIRVSNAALTANTYAKWYIVNIKWYKIVAVQNDTQEDGD